jgi:hypothetical protein
VWPILVALGILATAVGALTKLWLVFVGAVFAVFAVGRFALEHHRNPTHGRQIGDHGIDHRKVAMWTFLGSECILRHADRDLPSLQGAKCRRAAHS